MVLTLPFLIARRSTAFIDEGDKLITITLRLLAEDIALRWPSSGEPSIVELAESARLRRRSNADVGLLMAVFKAMRSEPNIDEA